MMESVVIANGTGAWYIYIYKGLGVADISEYEPRMSWAYAAVRHLSKVCYACQMRAGGRSRPH